MQLRKSTYNVPKIVDPAIKMIKIVLHQLKNIPIVFMTVTINNVQMLTMNFKFKGIPIRLLINILHVVKVAILI